MKRVGELAKVVATGDKQRQTGQARSGQPQGDSLPDHWIAAIFAKLALRYGHKWTSQYPASDDDEALAEEAMREWAQILGDLSPAEIKAGLEALGPGFPPDVYEFRQLCRRHKRHGAHRLYRALPRPSVADDVVRRHLREMRQAIRGA